MVEARRVVPVVDREREAPPAGVGADALGKPDEEVADDPREVAVRVPRQRRRYEVVLAVGRNGISLEWSSRSASGSHPSQSSSTT